MPQRELFFKLQRIFRLAIAGTIGALNIAGITASCWLAQSAPFDTFLNRSLSFLTTPHRIGWFQFILADYIPYAHKILTFIHQSDAIAAIILSSLTTSILTLIMFLLLQFNMPGRIAGQANRWEAKQATKKLRRINEAIARIDLYALPHEDAAELMRELDELYGQTLGKSRLTFAQPYHPQASKLIPRFSSP